MLARFKKTCIKPMLEVIHQEATSVIWAKT